MVLWDPVAVGFCVDPRWTRNQDYAARQGRVDFPGRFDKGTGQAREACPDDPAATVAAPGAGDVAASVWQHVENLPVPSVARATGLRHHRARRCSSRSPAPTAGRRRVDNPIGDDVTITATSWYVIDWGDPTYPTTDVTRSHGGPYPDGDVTHVYTQTATRTQIKVMQRWTATWRAGAGTGTLEQLTTEAPPLDLEVRQLQAVRDR